MKIPFLLHINSPKYPGFVEKKESSHGIWNFENSGFYKEAIKAKIFPESIAGQNKDKDKEKGPAILAFYHIGSLGTFTQSKGSDFDYWVIIDKKDFSKERYDGLEEKLDALVKYSREDYHQEVTFFIMDRQDIKNDCYAPFKGEETLTAPKIFLKEEFYRTYLMVAGKIPLWSVLPDIKKLQAETTLTADEITTYVLSMYEDLIDLGQVDQIPVEDVLKGLLWHICKSRFDPIKAVIKATMVFSYGFGKIGSQVLLCEKVKQGYAKAGIDDYGVDPYKALFDRILEFYENTDIKSYNLLKNAVFFRLCEYPDVKIPDTNTPKRLLLDRYIRTWKLNKTQVGKLLSYSNWSEAEKLLLEKTFVQHLAQMFNQAVQKAGKLKDLINQGIEKRNWTILKNKTRERLKKDPDKILECSTYLKRRTISRLEVIEEAGSWELNFLTDSGQRTDRIYKHEHFLSVLGWILENQLYNRHTATMRLETDLKLFEAVDTPVDLDRMYMIFQPLKPFSDTCYEKDASWAKMLILLFYDQDHISRAEFLISNTWGELFLDAIEFSWADSKEELCTQIANLMLKYENIGSRFFIYQFSSTRDPGIVYQLKKAYSDLAFPVGEAASIKRKPYLDRL